MNDLFINSMFPGMNAGSIGMSPNVEANLGANLSAEQGTQFLDLLGLVSDMEIADSQVGNTDSMLEERSNELLQAHKTAVLGGAPLTGMDGLMAQSLAENNTDKVGQGLVSNNMNLETSVASLNANDMVLNAGLKMEAPAKGSAVPDLKAAALWAAAIDSGDLKSVENQVATRSFEANSKVNEAAKVETPLKAEFKRVDFPKVEEVGVASQQSKSPKRELSTKANKVQNAGDFMLGRLDNSTQGSAKSISFESPFIDAQKVGSPEDKRVSSEALNFVGQKVQDLKNSGGGEVKVDLHPKHLGALEIRVGMVHGKMEVTISAENPDTLKALQNSSEQLKGNLELIAVTDLKVQSKMERPAEAMTSSSLSVATKSAPSSQDLMSMHDLKGSAAHAPRPASIADVASRVDTNQMQGDGPSAPIESRESVRIEPKLEASRSSGSMQDDASPEGKSEAWERWEEYQRRKSA